MQKYMLFIVSLLLSIQLSYGSGLPENNGVKANWQHEQAQVGKVKDERAELERRVVGLKAELEIKLAELRAERRAARDLYRVVQQRNRTLAANILVYYGTRIL